MLTFIKAMMVWSISDKGKIMTTETKPTASELLASLIELRKQVHAHIKLDVKKHYSLMVADSLASTLIHRAGAQS